MFNGLNRSLQIIHIVMLSLILTGAGALLYLYWTSGLSNGQHISGLYETSSKLDDMKKSPDLMQLKKLAADNKVRPALRAFDAFQMKVHGLKQPQPSKELQESIAKVRNDFAQLLSLPELPEVLSVLIAKVDKFTEYVGGNEWRTLKRLSQRMRSKIPTQGSIELDLVRKVIAEVSLDLTQIKNVATTSLLSSDNKNAIVGRTGLLKSEMLMLEKYVQLSRSLAINLEGLQVSYDRWLSQVSPSVSLDKIKIEEHNKRFTMGLFGLLLLVSVFILAGVLLFKKQDFWSQKKVEHAVLRFLNEELLSEREKENHSFTDGFYREYLKVHEYLHRRMRFGQMFQDALPFASILLDDNLKLVWGNKAFFEKWNIEESAARRETLSWDYLQTLTNLGASDPIVESFKNNLAGIYQIQVKGENGTNAHPYEMYVVPVENAKQRMLMIFFYPLDMMEEAISNQVVSVIGPVKKAVEAMINDDFTYDFQEKLESDFEIASISEVFILFKELFQKSMSEKRDLLSEIQGLDNKLASSAKALKDIEIIQENRRDVLLAGNMELDRSKKCLMALANKGVEKEERFDDLNQDVVQLKNLALTLTEQVQKNTAKLAENYQVVRPLQEVREEFKQVIEMVENARIKVYQALEYFLNSAKTDGKGERKLSEKMEVALGKMRAENKNLEQILRQLDRFLTMFDVKVSKAIIMMNETDVQKDHEEFPQIEKMSGHLAQNVTQLMAELKGIFDDHFTIEEYLAQSMSDLSGHLEQNSRYDIHVTDLAQNGLNSSVEVGPLLNQ